MVLPGNAVISKAGKLPCHHVIHAVGPRWKGDKVLECVSLLKKVVRQSLSLAEEHRCRSIAMPAVSAGIFDFPLELCVANIVSAIKEHFQHKRDTHTLKRFTWWAYLPRLPGPLLKLSRLHIKTPFPTQLSHPV